MRQVFYQLIFHASLVGPRRLLNLLGSRKVGPSPPCCVGTAVRAFCRPLSDANLAAPHRCLNQLSGRGVGVSPPCYVRIGVGACCQPLGAAGGEVFCRLLSGAELAGLLPRTTLPDVLVSGMARSSDVDRIDESSCRVSCVVGNSGCWVVSGAGLAAILSQTLRLILLVYERNDVLVSGLVRLQTVD